MHVNLLPVTMGEFVSTCHEKTSSKCSAVLNKQRGVPRHHFYHTYALRLMSPRLGKEAVKSTENNRINC